MSRKQAELDFDHPLMDVVRATVAEAFSVGRDRAAGRKPQPSRVLPTRSMVLSQQMNHSAYRLVAELDKIEAAGPRAWHSHGQFYPTFHEYLLAVHGQTHEWLGDLRAFVGREKARRQMRYRAPKPKVVPVDPFAHVQGPVPF